MTLRDALDEVWTREDGVIFAARPWTLDPEAGIFQLEPDQPRPKEIADRGLHYFLEIHVAQEALGAFGEKKPTRDQARALIMHYAKHDGFPDWVYE